MPKKVFILSGEPSGDLHGGNLVTEILKKDPSCKIQCWGGDKMKAAGAEVLKHVDDLAFMGFIEVVANLPQILRNFKTCKNHIRSFQPDLVVFIDYPGFNLRMAEFVKQLGIQSVYYISPQIWAWKESRAKKIKRFIDHVYVILPFEKAFYKKHGINADFVGHPLLDEFKNHADERKTFRSRHELSENPIIAVLPGSRVQEIKKTLPLIAQLDKKFPNHQLVVSKVPWQDFSLFSLSQTKLKLVEGETYDLIANAEAAIVTSGTATLETALLKTPQIVVYKANAFSVLLARWLVKIKYISLVNLILDKEAVTELIQGDATKQNIEKELKLIVTDGVNRQKMLKDYDELIEKLGGSGASEIVATKLLKILSEPE